MREIIFDTETTGLSPKDGDRIIEIGALEMVNSHLTGLKFHYLVNPQDKEVSPDAEAIHGISTESLRDEKTFSDLLPEFLEFFGEGKLVAHNASFDMGFINSELERCGKPPISSDRVIDTLEIARRKHPGERNSLDALCKRYNISNAHRKLHGALLDSELLAEVYLELMGNRQVGLSLDSKQDSAPQKTESSSKQTDRVAKTRANALPPRLSDSDRQAHKDFIKVLGGKSLWRE